MTDTSLERKTIFQCKFQPWPNRSSPTYRLYLHLPCVFTTPSLHARLTIHMTSSGYGKQETWKHATPENMKPTLTGGFCERLHTLYPGLCLILIMDMGFLTLYPKVQHVPNLIHYLPPNRLSFCDSHLSQ